MSARSARGALAEVAWLAWRLRWQAWAGDEALDENRIEAPGLVALSGRLRAQSHLSRLHSPSLLRWPAAQRRKSLMSLISPDA